MKLKLKKGDLVRVDPPMLGVIVGANKKIGGYRIKVFASPQIEVAYYEDKDVYKVSGRSDWAKSALKYDKDLPRNKSKTLTPKRLNN